eukprot:4740239-Pyramimonas_sp.AAC.1
MACLGGSRPPPFYYEIWSNPCSFKMMCPQGPDERCPLTSGRRPSRCGRCRTRSSKFWACQGGGPRNAGAVSYTHLTLPTILLV